MAASLRFSLCVALIALALTVGETPRVAGMTQDPGPNSSSDAATQEFSPVEADEIVPCCPTRPSRPDWDSQAATRGVEVPNGTFADPVTYRRLKARASLDPGAPKGEALEFADRATFLPSAPGLRRSFEGLDRLTAQHDGWIAFPPDTIVAAGPSHVLEATNWALRLSSKTNGNVTIQSLNDHFGVDEGADADSLLFDPKVYFDRLSERFFIVALEVTTSPDTSYIYLSVSRGDTSVSRGSGVLNLDLEDDWCNYKLTGKQGATWADYPGLGMNGTWAAIAVNNFKFAGGFSNVYLHVLDKASLVNNATKCPGVRRFVFKTPSEASGHIAFTVQPAQHYTESGLRGDPLFFVSSLAYTGTQTRHGLWQISGSSATGAAVSRPSLTRISLTGDDYSMQPDAPQKGGGTDLNTGDTRVMQAAFRDGELWATHATACSLGSAPNESCVRVLQITPNGGSGTAAALSGTVDFETTYGATGHYFWNPGIAVNKLGDVVVPFQRSSASSFLTAAYNGKRARASTFDAVRNLTTGKCNLSHIDSAGRNRTGDYVGAQTDPEDDLGFWIAGQYTKTVSGLSGCNWATRIANARY